MTIRKKGWACYRGKFPSLKLGRTVRWKSYLLRDYLYLLEFDPGVLSYEESPLEVNYTRARQRLSFTADLVVQRQGVCEFVKLVRDKDLSCPEGDATRLPVGSDLLPGYVLCVITESDVRRQPRLNNIKILWRYARAPISAPEHYLLCLNFFGRSAYARLGELVDFFRGRRFTEREVFSLIFHGILRVDMTAPLTRMTVVHLAVASETSVKGGSGCKITG